MSPTASLNLSHLLSFMSSSEAFWIVEATLSARPSSVDMARLKSVRAVARPLGCGVAPGLGLRGVLLGLRRLGGARRHGVGRVGVHRPLGLLRVTEGLRRVDPGLHEVVAPVVEGAAGAAETSLDLAEVVGEVVGFRQLLGVVALQRGVVGGQRLESATWSAIVEATVV